MSYDKLPVGTVVRVTRCTTEPHGGGRNILGRRKAAWAVTVDNPSDDYYEVVTWIDDRLHDCDCDALHVGYDEFEVIPEDKVPLRVWAKIAERALTK